jgi:hypothetical protein
VELLDDNFMRNPLPCGKFPFGYLNVPKDLEFFDQSFINCGTHEDRGTLAVLGKDQGSARLADLVHKRSYIGAEGGEGLNVLG